MQVPYDPSGNNVTPINPTPFQKEQIDVSPNDFGAQIGAQLEASQVIQNHLRASDADLQFTQKAEPLMAQYLSLQGRNAVDQQAGILQQLTDLRTDISASATNPAEQSITDANMNYRMGSYGREIGQHAAQQTKVWQNDTITGQITNTINSGMDDYMVPDKVQANVDRINSLEAQRGGLQGLPPEEVTANQTKASSDYIAAMIRKSADTSPQTASALYKTYGDKMDAAHQADVGTWLDNREYTNLMKTVTLANRQDAMAERALKDTQAASFAASSADVMQGKPLDEGKLSDMVRNQQLTPSQMQSLIKQNAEATNAKPVVDKSSPRAFIDLNAGIMAGVTSADDIANAQLKEEINGRQASILSQTLSKAGQISDNNRVQLQNLISQVVPNAKALNDLPQQQSQAYKTYRDVTMEWNRRTILNNEDPSQVAQDMQQKYQFPARHPEQWPSPKFGSINSLDDASKVYSATKNAFASGQIDHDTLAQQADIIKKYVDYYGAQPQGIVRKKPVTPSDNNVTQ